MTPDEIIAHRRRRLLALADELGNVSEACRQMGVSRTRYYEWKRLADLYGLEALTPKPRRKPQLPNATPTHVVSELLTAALHEPTLGARQLADRLCERGFAIAKTTVQKLLNTHELGRRRQRVARAAALAAQTSGLLTEAARDEGPFGFCHFAAAPGDLVAMDSFYIGNLKGVGKVYQLTAVDTATRWAIVMILVGPVNATHSIAFVDHVVRRMRRFGVSIRAILTDNGPEWVAQGFRAHLAAKGFSHRRIPPRSPNHNAVCERFHGTILQECWRPAFHRRRFSSIRQLQAEGDAFLVTYNTRRRNHGDFMRGRTPREVLDAHQSRKAS
ncbi:MAG: DDE-type integrase/transposase/recombinase [Actinomycetota bacterium]|nr:DDE-type integrase/transposase/recombinase [Actinomycetota bacterium]